MLETAEGESSDVRPDPDKSVSVKTNTDFTVHGCQVTRGRLDHLWDLARDGFPASSYASIEYKKRGQVESKFEAKSIDDLLSAVSRSAFSENLEQLDNLWLYISSHGRTVDIRVRDKDDLLNEGISVSISGDREWVHGRSSVLREFLESTRSSPFLGRGHSRWILGLIGFIAALGISLPSLIAFAQGKSFKIPLGLDVLLFVGLIGLGFSTGKIIDRRKRSRIILAAALDVHPRVAMQILRHSKIAITMEIYTMVPDQATLAALKRLSDALGPLAAELPDDAE